MEGVDKTFAPILGLPVVIHTIDRFELSPLVHQIVLVVAKGSLGRARELIRQRGYKKVTSVFPGGRRRQDSVRLGLEQLSACDWVMVHDGARPCLDDAMLERGMEAAMEHGSAIAGMPVKDTMKLVTSTQMVKETPDRSLLWAAQTPQIFRYRDLWDAHHSSSNDVTDDAAMIEALGYPVKMFLGSYENIKVTTADDLIIAETFLKSSSHRQ
jgi:2-C-methyl-D-erythritol 4-phosphate cytidylyltransferase